MRSGSSSRRRPARSPPGRVAEIVRRLPPEILTVGRVPRRAPERVVQIVHQGRCCGPCSCTATRHREMVAAVRARCGLVIKAVAGRYRPTSRCRAPTEPTRSWSTPPTPGSGRCSTGRSPRTPRRGPADHGRWPRPRQRRRGHHQGPALGCRRRVGRRASARGEGSGPSARPRRSMPRALDRRHGDAA